MDVAIAQQASDLLAEIQALEAELITFDLALAEGWRIRTIKCEGSGGGSTTLLDRRLTVNLSADTINDLKARTQNRLTNRQSALAALTG